MITTDQDATALPDERDAIVDHLSSNRSSEDQDHTPQFDDSSASKIIAVDPIVANADSVSSASVLLLCRNARSQAQMPPLRIVQ